MDRQRWLAASPFLDQALDLPADRIEAWLEALHSREPQIAADIRELLRTPTTGVFASLLDGQATPAPVNATYASEGEIIGHYRVLRELGHGGMAVVFLAERADGHFEQQVALKILRVGADAGETRLHFAQERQILASLNHPNIARLIDGGVTRTGLPYLAMEYVEGQPIDRYCDEKGLLIPDRLTLFVKVAEVVRYAHQRLIVHRDLKPSNIFVTADVTVKLLDFGIAKLLEPGSLAHAVPPARDVGRLMTPAYASPEQARGEPITTVTDIYQLGILLYQLLTGRMPRDLRGRSSPDALQVIGESEPPPPSTLSRHVAPDLEAIVMKALRKDPERRYSSVGRLIEDVERYLQGRPVLAHEGAWTYRARKFVRRRAAGVAIAAVAACVLGFVIVWYTIQLANERDRVAMEAERARREAATTSQVSEFLSGVLRGSRTRVAKGDTSARELLDVGAARIDQELGGQPQVQGRLLNVIGEAYVQYDVKDKAQPLLERALQLNMQHFGPRSREVSDSQFALATLARNQGDFKQSIRLYEQALAIREQTLGRSHVAVADVLNGMAGTLYRMGEEERSIGASERAFDIYKHSLGQDDERSLNVINTLIAALSATGDLKGAQGWYEQLVQRIERNLGPDHPHLGAALTNQAMIKLEVGIYEGIEAPMRRALTILERVYGPRHSNVTLALTNLGTFLFETGRLREATEVLERAIATQREVAGPGHLLEATAQNRFGRVLHARGDYEAARERYLAALEIRRKAFGPTQRYAIALGDLGELWLDEGKLEQAAPPLREALAILRKELPAKNYDVARALAAEGVLKTRAGMAREAEAQIRQALSIYEYRLLPGHPMIAAANAALGECLLAQGRLPEAERRLLESARQLGDKRPYERRRILTRLIQLYQIQHNPTAAQRFRDELAAFERLMTTG